MLDEKAFQALVQLLGPCTTDLFALRLNFQLTAYVMQLPPQSICNGNRCISNFMAECSGICLSIICSHRQKIKEKGSCGSMQACMASVTPGKFGELSSSSPNEQGSPMRPFQ